MRLTSPSCPTQARDELGFARTVTGASTARVVLPSMKKTWIFVGDGSHARLFQVDGDDKPWTFLRKVDREHSREKTDRAGAHEDKGEHDFARKMVVELEAGRQEKAFEELILVAPPKFLGQLRGELGVPLAACVVRSIDHDYTHVSNGELPEHIALV